MNSSIHPRVYDLLLLAYPAEFRREYGPQMTQVFRDCCRDQLRRAGKIGLVRVWYYTLIDLIQTALKERIASVGKENSVMNNSRRDAIAWIGCIVIIAIAFMVLQYGRSHEISSILMLGFILDALVTTGVVGNLVVFLLAKTTKLNPLRVAFWTFLIVHAVPASLLSLIGSRVDPQFKLGSVVIGYLVSFIFWYGLHWMWAQRSRGQVAA